MLRFVPASYLHARWALAWPRATVLALVGDEAVRVRGEVPWRADAVAVLDLAHGRAFLASAPKVAGHPAVVRALTIERVVPVESYGATLGVLAGDDDAPEHVEAVA